MLDHRQIQEYLPGYIVSYSDVADFQTLTITDLQDHLIYWQEEQYSTEFDLCTTCLTELTQRGIASLTNTLAASKTIRDDTGAEN